MGKTDPLVSIFPVTRFGLKYRESRSFCRLLAISSDQRGSEIIEGTSEVVQAVADQYGESQRLFICEDDPFIPAFRLGLQGDAVRIDTSALPDFSLEGCEVFLSSREFQANSVKWVGHQ
jgi:hypothetical protein